MITGTKHRMGKRSKRITYTRADRVILAAVDLMECGDFSEQDPDGSKRHALDAACDAAREIRDQLPGPGLRNR
jgi:hypothetical protein